MKKFAFAIALSLAIVGLFGAMPASAGEFGRVGYTATAPNPCATACPYWTDATDGNEAACLPSPLSVPASWHDRNVTMPGTAKGVVFRITPAIDYDSWICRHSSSPDPLGNFFVANGANNVGDVCGFVMIGCSEEVDAPVCPTSPADRLGCFVAGETVRLRVYNWSDGPTTPAEYAFFN